MKDEKLKTLGGYTLIKTRMKQKIFISGKGLYDRQVYGSRTANCQFFSAHGRVRSQHGSTIHTLADLGHFAMVEP